MRAPSSRTAAVLRTVLSAALLSVFWGALVRAYWPEIAVGVLRAWQGAQGAGAAPVVTGCLETRNIARVEPTVFDQTIARLEGNCRALQAVLGGPPERPIPVLLQEGSGSAMTDGRRLLVYHHRGRVDLSAAPLFLVLLWSGDLNLSSVDLFAEASFALYAVEEAELSVALIGQSTEQWVVLLRERGALLPLVEAQGVTLPGSVDEAGDLARAALQGASFLRWTSEVGGVGAPQDLLNGLAVENVVGLPLEQAEKQWLAWVDAQGVQPAPCEEALSTSSPLRGMCGELDRLSR